MKRRAFLKTATAAVVSVAAAGAAAVLMLPGLLPGAKAGGRSVVEGSFLYRERIALPPGAKAIVELLDISIADAPSKTLARQTMTLQGRRMPYQFSLHVASSRLKPALFYSVAVRILSSGDKLLWISDEVRPIKPGLAKQSVGQIVLKKVGR